MLSSKRLTPSLIANQEQKRGGAGQKQIAEMSDFDDWYFDAINIAMRWRCDTEHCLHHYYCSGCTSWLLFRQDVTVQRLL